MRAGVRWRAPRTGMGLQLEPNTVSLVALETVAGGGLERVAAGVRRLPEGLVVEGQIRQPEAVAVVVRALLADCGVKEQRVALSLPARSVLCWHTRLPALNPERRQGRVLREAVERLGADPADLAVDARPEGPVGEDGRQLVRVAAARQERVRERVELAEAVGLEPMAVELETQAVRRALHRWRAHRPSGATAARAAAQSPLLAEVGAGQIRVTWLAGPDALTEREHASPMPTVGGWSRVLAHLQAASALRRPDAVWLCGGQGAAHARDWIEAELGMPVELVEPFEGIAARVHQQGDRPPTTLVDPAGPDADPGLCACGLALRGLVGSWS